MKLQGCGGRDDVAGGALADKAWEARRQAEDSHPPMLHAHLSVIGRVNDEAIVQMPSVTRRLEDIADDTHRLAHCPPVLSARKLKRRDNQSRASWQARSREAGEHGAERMAGPRFE